MTTGWWSRSGRRGPRASGYPASANRASSFHLRWGGLPPDLVVVGAEATLEVVEAPVVSELYFWALQVGFADRRRRTGGAHLGLQWHPAHPGAAAVNFGGYRAAGGELDGSASPLPSATANPNTRDLDWQAGRPYRLAVAPPAGAAGAAGEWEGSVDGFAVRRLTGGGDRLADLMVWSEVFARCDHQTVAVRWSGFVAVAVDGERHTPDRLTVTYQSGFDGGCDNTDVDLDGDGIVQFTNRPRRVPHGTVLPLR